MTEQFFITLTFVVEIEADNYEEAEAGAERIGMAIVRELVKRGINIVVEGIEDE